MGKEKIALIELNYHLEVLQTLVEVMDYDRYDISLFVSPHLLQDLKAPPQLTIIPVQQSLAKLSKPLAEFDILFFNTLADDYQWVNGLAQEQKVIIRIHNVNTWFGPQRMATPQSIYEGKKFLSHWVRKELQQNWSKNRQELIPNVAQFVFPNQIMLESATALRPDVADKFYKQAIALQFGRYAFGYESDVIVIPGRIDQRKKDYDFALSVFKKVKEAKKIVLLGRPEGRYGKRIIKKFREELKQHEIIAFNDFIAPEVFNDWMRRAALVFLPIRPETSFTMYREYYGQTKESGGVNDAMSWHTPFLIPDVYALDARFKELGKTYHDQDDLIHYLTEENRSTSQDNRLTKEDVRAYYNHLFDTVLNG